MEVAGGAAIANLRVRDGRRRHLPMDYLYPVLKRPNMTVLTGAEVQRLGHSTAGDAARVAKAASVARLVLTHLPSEALAEPMLAEARSVFDGPVELARDLGLIEL